MTTSTVDEFACQGWVKDGGEAAIETPTVLDVTVTGSSATAQVSYVHRWANYTGTPAEVTLALGLERRGDEWLVVLPDTYQLLIEFNAPAVAVATIEQDSRSENRVPTCDVRVNEGKVEVLALPGVYNVTYSDPTGIMDYFNVFTIGLVGGAQPYVIGEPGAVTTRSKIDLDDAVISSVGVMVFRCASTAEAHPAACPPELKGTQLLDPTGQPSPWDGQLTWWPIVPDRIWTDDGETWLFSTKPKDLPLSRDGVPVTLEVSYSGHFEVDDDGRIVAVVDL